MSRNEICHSLNKVFKLMIGNKLREDMDDTLLEKLLSVIKLKISQDFSGDNRFTEKLNIAQDLLSNTQVLNLAEKVIISLNNSTTDMSPTIQKFTIQLVGVLFGNKDVFILYKDSIILKELSNAVRNNVTTTYLPTVQCAILLCFTNMTKHFEGIIWLKDENLMQFVFSSFSSSSYHVRAKAVSFFTEVLTMWTSSNMSLLPVQEQFLLNNLFKNIVLDLISGIRLHSIDQENNTIDCCLLVLKDSFEISNIQNLVNSSSVLKQQFSHYFECLTNCGIVNEKVLNLLLCVFTSGGVSELFIQDVVKLLISHSLFASAVDLVGSILRYSKENMPILKQHIQFLTLPLKILVGNSFQKNMADIFGLSCQEIHESVSKIIEVKSDCIKIIISCLLSLSKLTKLMNPDALEDTLLSISIVITGPTCCQNHPMSYVCLENRRICFALLELLSSILREKVYASMKFKNQLNVINYLMCFIENRFDYNVTAEVLRLLGSVTILNNKYSILLPDEEKEKVVHLLCKKLMDKTETIVLSALSVVDSIIRTDENQFWKDVVLKQNLHQIVWEMGVDGIQDGVLKAASLQTTLQVCRVLYFWEDIQSSKKVKEEDVMKIFFRYYRDPDFYVQRESLTCIIEWLKDKEAELPLACRDQLLIILSEAMKSLDMDQKDIALKAWTWLLESDKFFPGAMKNLDNLLKAVCKSGFAFSLILAIEDYDEAIQYKATEILIKFRETLQKMGCTEDYTVADESKWNSSETKLVDEFSFEHISKEDRDAGIENVVKLTTAEQIAKLAIIPNITNDSNSENCVPVQMDTLSFPINSFLKYVWSNSLNCIISKSNVSTDLFSEYTLSLLDDIIASNIKDICRPVDDIPDCY
ncbi:uncharacterized protein LOC129965463 [Argiope bruennichi]|uniref:BRCA1-associated ATM activator 1 n=1 Tax=Argiope bruennichi TaxID=94029 RepID=A0A8T0EDE8_ARGBR|nr:uncharacterized protein LOC129965463 [Argiope bruennichi]KAF8768461.1 hypothetical protein HNY73_021279 [Argiope bruennichi]